jgi:hypothetical protein
LAGFPCRSDAVYLLQVQPVVLGQVHFTHEQAAFVLPVALVPNATAPAIIMIATVLKIIFFIFNLINSLDNKFPWTPL